MKWSSVSNTCHNRKNKKNYINSVVNNNIQNTCKFMWYEDGCFIHYIRLLIKVYTTLQWNYWLKLHNTEISDPKKLKPNKAYCCNYLRNKMVLLQQPLYMYKKHTDISLKIKTKGNCNLVVREFSKIDIRPHLNTSLFCMPCQSVCTVWQESIINTHS